MKSCIFTCLFISIIFSSQAKAQTSLLVTISNLKNEKGNIKLAVYNSSDGYPGNGEKALEKVVVKIKGNAASYTFQNMAPGTYAIAAYHDENGNDKIDTNFFGVPKEGTGASNNASSWFGPPKFSDAKFNIGNKACSISFRMSY